ncbi:hypothetical protein RI367_000001, partial [Sorochytrium milnesiophthora]
MDPPPTTGPDTIEPFVLWQQEQERARQQQNELMRMVLANQQQLQQLLLSQRQQEARIPGSHAEDAADAGQQTRVRLPVPRFEGKVAAVDDLSTVSEIDDVDIFIARLGSYFRACRTPEYAQLAVLESALSGPAAAWYWGLVKSQAVPTTWLEMMQSLRNRFAQPSRIRTHQRAFFDSKQQRAESVAAYAARLQLPDAATPGRAEVDRVEVFLRGLLPATQLDARKAAPVSLSHAIQAATISEQASASTVLATDSTPAHDFMVLDTVRARQEGPAWRRHGYPREQTRERPPARCWTCNELGHIARNCRQSTRSAPKNGHSTMVSATPVETVEQVEQINNISARSLWTIDMSLGRARGRALIDSGASHSFVSSALARASGLLLQDAPAALRATVGNNSTVSITTWIPSARLQAGDVVLEDDL